MPKNALAQVLLDFGRTPGRYALRLREPQELFAQFDTVALWAQGRVPDALAAQAERLEAAAVLFIQRACFAQENNHYQILGLVPGPLDAELLRTRYRSMIRLTHPDMGVEGLPSGAAGMVNRAQKVLADPELRQQYDQQLEGSSRPNWQGVEAAPVSSAAAPSRAERRQLDRHHHGGLGGRWRTLWARYPTQLRLLLTTAGVGVLVVGLLAWAANDAPGGALVVVRAPAQPAGAGSDAQRTAPLPNAEPTAAPTVANAPDYGEDKSILALAQKFPGTGAMPQAANLAAPPKRREAPTAQPAAQFSAAAPAERLQERTEEPVVASKQLAPRNRTMNNASPPGLDPAAERPVRDDRVRTAAVPATSPPTRPPALPAPPAIATPVVESTLAVTPAQPVAPAMAPTAPAQWSVDVPGATQYLRDLIVLLENPQQAGRTQELLRSMNVKGNLLAPGLRLAREGSQLRVNSIALGETRRPAALELRGTVQVQAQNSAGNTMVQYRVAAHFVALESGTALTRLDLVEPQ